MKTKTQSYKDLVVWQKGIVLAKIARHTTGEFVQFISHAEGSLAELDTQLTLSIELNFCDNTGATPAFELVGELRRMLNVLRRKLVARQ